MRHSIKTGLSFGLTSAIITTIGLMVGLYSGTNSQLAVIGGILLIATADAFSDSLAIHISEESEDRHTTKQIWQSTASTFVSKFIFAVIFIVPVLLLELSMAIIASIILGLLLLSVFSFNMAREQKKSATKTVAEHIIIAGLVIIFSYYLGVWVASVFG